MQTPVLDTFMVNEAFRDGARAMLEQIRAKYPEGVRGFDIRQNPTAHDLETRALAELDWALCSFADGNGEAFEELVEGCIERDAKNAEYDRAEAERKAGWDPNP